MLMQQERPVTEQTALRTAMNAAAARASNGRRQKESSVRIIMLLVAGLFVSPQVALASEEVVVVAEPGVGRGVAMARDGTRYVAGGAATQPGSSGHLEPFLVALDPGGQVRWRLGWEGIGQAAAVAATPEGPVVIVRFGEGPFDADPGAGVASFEGRDGLRAVAVALDSEGGLRWTWSAPRADLQAIAALPDGSVAIAGTAAGGLGFVAAVDSLGGTTWSRQLDKSPSTPYAIAASDAALYVTGLGNGATRPGQSFAGTFVARLGLDGNRVWLRRLGARGSILKGYAIAANEARVVVGGLFRGRPDFDPGPARQVRASADADDDGFVAVFDVHGALTWVHTHGAASSDQVRGVALEGERVYALGSQTEVVDLGGAAGIQAPETKWFLLAIDGDSTPRASTPIAVGAALTYSGMYVGAMIAHHGRALITADVSRSLRILGRPVTPVAGGANSDRAVLIDLALPSTP